MSSFRNEVYDLLFEYVRVWQGKSDLWAAALEPETLGDRINPMPPGQRFKIEPTGVKIYSELDWQPEYLVTRKQFEANVTPEERRTLWAARHRFSTRESATNMIFGWIRLNRPELLQACVNEAMAGRAYRSAQLRKETARG